MSSTPYPGPLPLAPPDDSPDSQSSALTPKLDVPVSPTPVARSATRFEIDYAQPLDPRNFPNPPRGGSYQPPTTIPNVAYLLKQYGVRARYSDIKRKVELDVPGLTGMPENRSEVALTTVLSLAALNGMSLGLVPSTIEAIADRHPFNPVAEWISRAAWDGVDRLSAFYATLEEQDGFPSQLKQELMRRWMLGAVTAAFTPTGFHTRGVLTLQGAQGIGKTAWVRALVPDAALREQVVKLDHHLDAHNKDSLLSATSHWLVEIGELDSSFRKDIARLKGFLTNDRDKVRRPYARADSEFPRRTIFIATVNDANFLVDSTGNTRFWTIPVKRINYSHGIEMQQLFAQLYVEFKNGERWWLEPELEKVLEMHNAEHRSVSAIREQIADSLDLESKHEAKLPVLTAIEILQRLQIERPTNMQLKEANAALRELLGESKRVRGRNVWRVPFRKEDMTTIEPEY